ncbi:phosphoglycerate kinase [uncultured Mesonia sp.]|uniref:phosphoglycerate kinase n=1 Tax=uncultured Mesonia sp. TaxID=399731 RepID=UPI00374E3479
MKTIDQFNFKDKKALIRVDFNVPLNEDFEVTDTTRILAAKPSIDKILNQGGAAILMSHLGRPENQEQKYSLKHIVPTLSEILGVEVKFVENCVGSKAEEAANQLKAGEVLLLENLRYHKEEKQGDSEFAKALASLGDIYVNDAFGTAHRAHASTTVVAQFFEHKCFGYLLAKEIESINKVFQAKEKPVTAILGGAKVSSKITVISHILDKIDHLIIGGGMTFTFIKALGGEVGSSLVEDDKLALALQILEEAKAKKVQVHLPVDAVIADAFKDDAKIKLSAIDNIPENWMGLDVGPETSKLFEQIIQQSQIILWNGPVGVFEMSSFAKGTLNLGNAIAKATKEGAFSLVGGGDSVAAVKQFGLADQVSYVSTGGGAMLEMLEGKELPGIAAINKD